MIFPKRQEIEEEPELCTPPCDVNGTVFYRCRARMRFCTAKTQRRRDKKSHLAESGLEYLLRRAEVALWATVDAKRLPMKTHVIVCLSMCVGIVIGSAAVQTSHAQAKPPVYSVAEIDVKNVDGYMKEYVPVARSVIKNAGGKLVAVSLHVKALQGDAPKERIAIVHWNSLEAAEALFSSTEWKDAQKIGQKYATFRIYAVDGVPQ